RVCAVLLPESEGVRHGRTLHDLPGVRPVLRVEELLDLPVELRDLGSEHQREELASGEPVPMLAGKRPPELDDQFGDITRDRLHPTDIFATFQVQIDADVEATLPRMAEETEGRTMSMDDLLEPAGVGTQLFR